jgi:surface antigen
MQSRRLVVVVCAGVLAAASGCTEIRQEQTGALVGGVLGGALGSQVGSGSGRTAAIVAGTLAGALIGGSVGRSMDRADQERAYGAFERAPTGETVAWQNPDTSNRYEVTPTRTYNSRSGPCRDYEMDAWVDGRKETVTGTACRQSDGTWRTM